LVTLIKKLALAVSVLMMLIIIPLAAAYGIESESQKEEGYPPEYEELFRRFRPLTPDEALMFVSATGYRPSGGGIGCPILPPIVVKTLDGKTSYYVVIAHIGEDDRDREAAEEMIATLNDEGGFDPYEFAGECETFYEQSWEFCAFIVNPWPWHGGPKMASGDALPPMFDEYKYFEDLAEKEFGEGNLARGWFRVPYVFYSAPLYVFKLRDGTTRYVHYYTERHHRGGGPKVLDLEFLEVENRWVAGRISEEYREKPELLDEAEARWAETLEYIKAHAVREGGYYRLRDIREGE
jgi:hypothetical protein